MRYSLLTLTLAGIAFAAEPSPVTYTGGNLEGFATNASATLEFRDMKAMVLRAKDSKAEISYAAVSKTERKTVPVVSEKDPLYKVWSLHKRLLVPEPLESITLTYHDKSGAEKSASLEMEKAAADRLQNRVAQAAARTAANNGAWWGDSVWKTARNKAEWGGAGVVAQRE